MRRDTLSRVQRLVKEKLVSWAVDADIAAERVADLRGEVGISGHPDKVARSRSRRSGSSAERQAAELAAAMERQRDAERWAEVFRRTDQVFPLNSPVGQVVDLRYRKGLKWDMILSLLHYSAPTGLHAQVNRYVDMAAMIAASMGLLEEVLPHDRAVPAVRGGDRETSGPRRGSARDRSGRPV